VSLSLFASTFAFKIMVRPVSVSETGFLREVVFIFSGHAGFTRHKGSLSNQIDLKKVCFGAATAISGNCLLTLSVMVKVRFHFFNRDLLGANSSGVSLAHTSYSFPWVSILKVPPVETDPISVFFSPSHMLFMSEKIWYLDGGELLQVLFSSSLPEKR